MRSIVLSSLLAGFIAGFIWMAITVLTGGWSRGAIAGGGLGFLVGTAVIAGIITAVIRRSKQA
jgi:hypothetical protein